MKFSGLMKGYLAWTLAVALGMSSALGMGWRIPTMMGGGSGYGVGAGHSRTSGGYYPHSSWSFGK
jgi:hypothetical protein